MGDREWLIYDEGTGTVLEASNCKMFLATFDEAIALSIGDPDEALLEKLELRPYIKPVPHHMGGYVVFTEEHTARTEGIDT